MVHFTRRFFFKISCNLQTVHLRTPKTDIEIIPVNGTFEIKINSKVIEVTTVMIGGGYTYETFETKQIRGEITPFGGPNNKDSNIKQLALRLRTEGVKVIMLKNSVEFKVNEYSNHFLFPCFLNTEKR